MKKLLILISLIMVGCNNNNQMVEFLQSEENKKTITLFLKLFELVT